MATRGYYSPLILSIMKRFNRLLNTWALPVMGIAFTTTIIVFAVIGIANNLRVINGLAY